MRQTTTEDSYSSSLKLVEVGFATLVKMKIPRVWVRTLTDCKPELGIHKR